MSENKPFKLPTRYSPKTGKFQIEVDGRWRQKKSWDDTCFHCQYEGRGKVRLEYYGVKTADGSTNFWGQCPRCGRKTAVEWVGKPRERHPGGTGHGHLRFRRARSGY